MRSSRGYSVRSRLCCGKARVVTSRTTPDIAAVVLQHRRIFEAVRAGDPELAKHAMREHLNMMALDLIAGPKS